MSGQAIFERAAARVEGERLAYAGAVTVEEAHQLAQAGLARIVDVRTRSEYEHVGHIEGTPLIEWRRDGEHQPDPKFAERVAAAFPDRGEPLLLLCRSGVRSHHAAEAAARAGFARVFNVLEGFEGDLDGRRQRGALGGWRAAGLPWEQS
jgi:rhodanese-related sulfurtransferase